MPLRITSESGEDMGPLFEWDDGKAQQNLLKHGVSFDEATTVFDDLLSQTAQDPRHSDAEERFATIGQAAGGRVIVVAHTDTAGVIRIISARVATPCERIPYEEQGFA